MERELLSPKVDRRAYVKARLLEVLYDLKLALAMFNSGASRNAAGKAFGAVKALLSALVVENSAKIVQGKGEEERRWYERKGYTVPTHGMKSVGLDLAQIGFTAVDFLVDKALNLHDYQYNGFDPDFSPYMDKRAVRADMSFVVSEVLSNLKSWFQGVWDEELEREYSDLRAKSQEFSKQPSPPP